MSTPTTILITTRTQHNMKIPKMVHHVLIDPLFGVKVPMSHIAMLNYLMEIHHMDEHFDFEVKGLVGWMQI